MEFDSSQMQTWPAHIPEQTNYGMLDASQQYYPVIDSFLNILCCPSHLFIATIILFNDYCH